MSEHAVEAVQQALTEGEHVIVTSPVEAEVRLTPSSVRTTRAIRLYTPRAHFITPLAHKRLPLDTWETLDEDEESVRVAGLYRSGLKFPERCCLCRGPVSHYEVVEIRNPVDIVDVPTRHVSRPTARRLASALGCDRYWVALPFCKLDGLNSRAVHFNPPFTQNQVCTAKVEMTNRLYAQEFAEMNGLTGRWRAVWHLVLSTLGIFGMVGGGLLAGGMGYLAAMGLNTSARISLSMQQTLILLVVGMVVLAGGTVLSRLGMQGESLEE